MSWWWNLLRRLRGESHDDDMSIDASRAPRTSDGPPVFECQACFKVFDSDQSLPVCPECDSTDVKTLTS